jgi:hypothetical protein
MDDRSIAWMMSGGLRTQTRDDRLQPRHRLDLALATPQRRDPLAFLAAIASQAHAGRTASGTQPVAGPALDCCVA